MLLERLVNLADAGLKMQSGAGPMPAGRNGAYGDPETPVRNTSHWLTSFCVANAVTGEAKFREAAERALRFLLACVAAVPGGIPVRQAPTKDRTNGVLGQAHLLESLFYAAVALQRDDAWQAGIDLIKRHSWNESWNLWNRVTPSGKILPPDETFNHQLYFAAAVALFAPGNEYALLELDRFIAGTAYTFQTRVDGRVVHSVRRPANFVQRLRHAIREPKREKAMATKEADYHLYNMYGYALLAASGKDPMLNERSDWHRAKSFVTGPAVKKRITATHWMNGLSSGTETAACDLAFFNQVFGEPDQADLDLAEEMLDFTGGPDGSFSLYSPDPVTQQARHYRYWRLIKTDSELRGRAPSMGGGAG
ncbi:hypothetical protein HNO88_004178 [Novosphingobium chloroacetimidivorans]|uniref:Alginate lyase domain-containing protein n=1 Tax=Novosphingobium chloroacetimidivorans TaxID=1428314 RepID=A0A7W7KEP7_9SPHN|nr:hypothetical protein [Novosphingobium chloroacetimidivorans]MBB4860833.1 hypothetical protein [Novosphingobium chloroacetimidivorans]